MHYKSMGQRFGKWLLVASFFGSGLAMAQAEPTLNQVYAAAQAGKLNDAQTMIQQVLVSHPNSAKAHFVRAELYGKQGDLAHAREELASAEKFAPGLPFAKADAVQALRAELAVRNAPRAPSGSGLGYAAPVSRSSTASWGLPLLLAGAVIAAGFFLFRRRPPAAFAQEPTYTNQYTNQNGLSGPQTFGMAGGAAMPPSYGPPAYGQPSAGSGMGSHIMGGLATGLAVGAGVMAAEAIGRNLMGNHNQASGPLDNFSAYDPPSTKLNPDMGGQDFGINDAGSWDDAGAADMGSDWDN